MIVNGLVLTGRYHCIDVDLTIVKPGHGLTGPDIRSIFLKENISDQGEQILKVAVGYYEADVAVITDNSITWKFQFCW